MKNRKSFIIGLAVLLLGGASCWFLSAKSAKTDGLRSKRRPIPVAQSPASSLSPIIVNALYTPGQIQTGRVINGMLSRNPRAIISMTQLVAAGVSKEEITKGIQDAQNAQPINDYCKVVDQYGSPVVGATVVGSILLNVGFENSGYESHTTTTDAQGLFQFTGLHGISLGLSIKKAGYESSNLGEGAYKAPNKEDKTSPNERDIIIMWKLKGAEPMAHWQLSSRVPYDGTSAAFNLTTGKKDDNGDLRITLIRNPLQINRSKDHYEWNVKIEIVDGGLIESHDPYPYAAPEKGYQPIFEFVQTKDAPGWTRELAKLFYVHTGANTYGRVKIDLFSDAARPDTGIIIEAWMNPLAVPDLEFDPAKQIKSK